MKKYAVIIFFVFVFFSAPPAEAQNHFQQGRALLFANGELTVANAVAAKPEFEAAVNDNPTDQMANLFLAVCRLLSLMDNNASYSPGPPIENVKELLDGFGINSADRELFAWRADFSRSVDGSVRVPPTCPTGAHVQAFLETLILPEIDQALQNLSGIGADIRFWISAAETGETYDIEIDYGDVLIFRALLHAAKSGIRVLSSYNVNVDFYRIIESIRNDLFNPNADLIDRYTDFLKLLDTGGPGMLEARDDMVSAIESYLEASGFIRSETDDQMDDLIALDPQDLQNEADFRVQITEVKDSIEENRVAVLELDSVAGRGRIDFHRIFGTELSSPLHSRDFIPLIDNRGNIYTHTFPDTTFGGILPDCTDEPALVEFMPFRLPIVFPIFKKTMVMDGNEDDWQTVYPILPPYFESSWSWNWGIEYVKVAQDNNYFYWMVKFNSTAVPGRSYNFSVWDEEDGWNWLSINISQDSTYNASNWSMNIHYTGTEQDYGIGNIVEGRVPRSYIRLDGIFDVNASSYYWDSRAGVSYSAGLYGSGILTGTAPLLAATGSDKIAVGSVTLEGKTIFPDRTITSWQWSLEHTSDPSQNRTATGPNPTLDNLAPGFYEVFLRATDDFGQTSTDTMLLAVLGANNIISRDECDQEVIAEKRKWIGHDEKIGLEEAIRALQVVSGMRP